MKFNLYEKSYHKSKFLKDVAENFDLNVEVFKKDIFNQKNLKSDLIISRAFKPLPVVLNLVNSNFIRFKNIIFFLGKNSKEILAEALRNWQFEYKEKKSLTNKDSFLLNIFNLKKNE